MKIKDVVLGLAIFILLHGGVMAQDTLLISPAKVDSLHQLIANRKKEDEEKVRLLNEYARLCFYNQEFQLGFITTRDAREMSKRLDFTGGEIMYYMTLAAFQGSGEMYNYYLQQARSIDIKANSQFSKYTVELDIPIGYPPTNHQLRLDKLRPVLQYFEDLADKEIELAIMDPVAWSYYRLGRLDELKTNLKKAAVLSRDINQLYPEFLARSRLKSILDSEGNTEEGKKIEQELIELLSKSGDDNENGYLKFIQANYYNYSGQYALAIDYYLKSIDAFESTGNFSMLGDNYGQLGWVYEGLEMHAKALEIYEKYISLYIEQKDNTGLHNAYNRPVYPLYELKRYDEARKYMALALQGSEGEDRVLLEAKSNSLEGQILLDQGAYDKAIPYLQKTYETYSKLDDDLSARHTISFTLLYMAQCYHKMGDMKSALNKALECLEKENALNHKRTIIKSRISFLISEIYIETGQPDKAFDYLKMHQDIITASNKAENANRVAEAEIRSIIDKSEIKLEELEKERIKKIQEARVQRLWIFSISGALMSAIILVFILFRNNKSKQKANALLKEQKEEIQSTLEKLESTQTQLIQSEKMASLGELTAGIAHEIQNPLNFVNNFSEVNKELVDELQQELGSGNLEDAIAISNDIKENEEKINHHGKRAEAIVKGMLQHSRTSNGKKELTDINVLADEYLRLAYHGLRAKDKSFNADFSTDLDETLPKIEVIPQDIGRVLLNLINNAFHAVSERAKKENADYKPLVSVSTGNNSPLVGLPAAKAGGQGGVFITVKDNGEGIPEQVRDKIFQPFFTTKPTGSGTGLGLSLSYDIVRAHGGKLTVETKEGIGTEFIIEIPFKTNERH